MVQDGTSRDYDLPPVAPFHNEGKTVAGWVMFWGVCLGAVVVALAIVLWETWILIVGVAVLVLALVASKVLSVMGMGQPRNRDNPPQGGEHNWYA
ncbi:hypothetical protein SAMN05216184_101806 [Georgenia satyanarayanai]|uniref:Uncharacterized protein n=1 Tax=Georgenia satyanarayanai TaxID=860221 RepID=A0A2Y8ZYM2_9MICO|nr:HGxxPAAW family protein [Georgenia satyanarayanai]PYG02333.1 hypothetical protein A8987_101806 [Georgenia satyanarayanai]SSA37204.1 hypothetical protein SAMN05216184_101806 [Georgenia satyanarayanai]